MATFHDLTADNMKHIYGYLDVQDRMALGSVNRRQTGLMGDYQKSLYPLMVDAFKNSEFQKEKCFFVFLKVKKENITIFEKKYIFSGYTIDALAFEYEHTFKYLFNTEFFDFTSELTRRLLILLNTDYNLVDEFIFKPVYNPQYNIQTSILPVSIHAKPPTSGFAPIPKQTNMEMM
jgi:hypothetical protein